MYEKEIIKSFSGLRVWQESHLLVISVYKATKKFPREEQFGLTNQIRRAIVSVSSNIAEGFGRAGMKDKIHFYIMAMGSLNEVQSQLLISRDIDYLKKEDWEMLEEKVIIINKMLNGLIRKSKSFTS